MPGSRHLYPDFHRGVSSCSDSFTLVQCRSFQGGGQQTVGPPPAPQCAQPSEETSWPWPAKDSAPSDLITSCAFSALQPWGTGVNVAPALTHSEKSACCSLFIYHPLLCLSSPFSSPSSTPSTTSFIIPACSFFTPPLHSFRDVNKSDNGGRWNDRISLSAGSLVILLLPPTPPLLVPACSCRHIAHNPGPRLNSPTLEKYNFSPHTSNRKIRLLPMLICEPFHCCCVGNNVA